MTPENRLALLHADILRHTQRLDYLCREFRETQESLADFLQDFYARVEANPEFLETLRKTSPAPSDADADKTNDASPFFSPSRADRETRNLYLRLVRKYHPDAAPDGGDPEQAKNVVHAYQERRIGSLWKISFEQEWKEIGSCSNQEQLAFLTCYRERIQKETDVMERRMRALYDSQEYQLQQSVFTARLQGVDLLSQIVGHIHEEGHRIARRMEYYRIRQQLIEESVWP